MSSEVFGLMQNDRLGSNHLSLQVNLFQILSCPIQEIAHHTVLDWLPPNEEQYNVNQDRSMFKKRNEYIQLCHFQFCKLYSYNWNDIVEIEMFNLN